MQTTALMHSCRSLIRQCNMTLIDCNTLLDCSKGSAVVPDPDCIVLQCLSSVCNTYQRHVLAGHVDFISREDALEVVLPHILDLDKEGGPGLGQFAFVQTPQKFYKRNLPVRP